MEGKISWRKYIESLRRVNGEDKRKRGIKRNIKRVEIRSGRFKLEKNIKG